MLNLPHTPCITTGAVPPHLSGLPAPRAGAAGRPPCAQRAAGCRPRCRSPAVSQCWRRISQLVNCFTYILVQNRVGITFPPWKSVWETEEVPGGGVTVMEGSLRSAWLRLRLIIQLDCNGYRCKLQTLSYSWTAVSTHLAGVLLCVLSQFSRTMWLVMATDAGCRPYNQLSRKYKLKKRNTNQRSSKFCAQGLNNY